MQAKTASNASRKRDRAERDEPSDASPDSPEPQATNFKRRRTESLAAVPVSDAACALNARQIVAFEERVVRLVSRNLEDTRALLKEISSLAEGQRHMLSL